MMRRQRTSRRKFIGRCAGVCSAFLTGILLWSACDNKEKQAQVEDGAGDAVDSCDDLSALSKEEIAVREKLGYVNESPIADNQCQNCNLYLPPKEGQKCGGCMLFKGPVFASAYCTYWAPKV